MDLFEKKDVQSRYAERITRLGPVVQALGWRDALQQELRFEVFKEFISFHDQLSILDIGCGFGDLREYLIKICPGINYVGCDLSPEVIEIAKKKNNGGIFEVRDIEFNPYSDNNFDYVCMSGIFNYKIKNNIKYLEEMIKLAFKFSKKGIIFNLTTDYVDYKSEELFYYSPEDTFRLCMIISKSIILRHDYPLYEFTVFCKKN